MDNKQKQMFSIILPDGDGKTFKTVLPSIRIAVKQ